MRFAKRYYSCVRNVIVYVLEITILNLSKEKNVLMRYKFLLVKTFYLFQVFSHMYSTIEELVTTINAIIKSN